MRVAPLGEPGRFRVAFTGIDDARDYVRLSGLLQGMSVVRGVTPLRATPEGLEVELDLLTGLAGFILIYMWTGTDHVVTQNNYNLLWALPTHLVAVFFLYKNKSWVATYLKATLVINLLLLLLWAFLPQQLNSGLIPLILLLAFRSWHLSNKKNDAAKNNNI